MGLRPCTIAFGTRQIISYSLFNETGCSDNWLIIFITNHGAILVG